MNNGQPIVWLRDSRHCQYVREYEYMCGIKRTGHPNLKAYKGTTIVGYEMPVRINGPCGCYCRRPILAVAQPRSLLARASRGC